jgi:Tfp pilus assembly protein PilV
VAFAEPEAGFGIAEIVVAMFLLGIIAVTFLPLLVQTLQVSSNNATLTTATQLVNQRLDLARAQTPTCAALSAFTGPAPAPGPNGVTFVVTQTVTCPTAPFPGTATFLVTVTTSGSARVLAAATTLVYVTG